MARLRVLILDENVTWRRVLSRVLSESDGLEVSGATGLGELGLEKIRQSRPDAVILSWTSRGARDPALRTLHTLKASFSSLPVLASSTVVERGDPDVLEFLTHGAGGFVSLPFEPNSEDRTEYDESLRKLLMPKLLRVAGLVAPAADPKPNPPSTVRSKAVEAVAIGVSTGGPDVLAKILPRLPASFPVPIFVVQHILPDFTRSLTERLQKACALEVREAQDHDVPTKGTIWIAPSGRHLEVIRVAGRIELKLSDAPPENMCRPAADVLFRSAARVYGMGLLAVVLTGMGTDGLRGCELIRETGGTVLVQDKASSVVWGMPGSVAEAGLAHEILTPDQIATELIRRVKQF